MGEPDPSAGEPHEILGVDPETPPGEIRIAAAKAKRAYNPDAHPPAEKRDAREAFYAVVAAERALLGDTPTGDDSSRGGGIDSAGTAETDDASPDPGPDDPSVECGVDRETTTDSVTGTGATAANTVTDTLHGEQPTLSFPDAERRRFDSDGGVTCRVVDAVSGESRSEYRIYAERVDSDERADDTERVEAEADGEADAVLSLSPGRWRICAERAREEETATRITPPTATEIVDSTQTADSTPAVDPVAVTVVRARPGDDTATDGRRLDGRTRASLSSVTAVVTAVGTAGVVSATYLDGLWTASTLASGLVAVAGVVSYRRLVR